MILASALGAAGFIWWVLALITAVFPARRTAAWRLVLALIFTFVISDYVLKPLFDRPRPFDSSPALVVIDARPQTPSFPSGHAAMATAGAIAGARMLPPAAWVLWPLAMVVAVSRVYVGVHWPSDVLAGIAVGAACAWFVLGGRLRYKCITHSPDANHPG